MRHRLIAALIVLLVAEVAAVAETNRDAPPVPYYDWGACPFECCTYREWITDASVLLRPAVGATQAVVETLARGEHVQAVTGVVVTRRTGRVKMLRAATLDPANPVTVRAGDILHTLHPRGEGVDVFWFKGRLHEHELYASAADPAHPPNREWQVLSIPRTEWWVQIKSARGRMGWSNEPQKFLGKDACG